MSVSMTIFIVYLVYGCLIAIIAGESDVEFIAKHPNIGTFVIVFMWGFIFTFLVVCLAIGCILGVKKNETNGISELEEQDKEDQRPFNEQDPS